jgi:hypothetical protein
MRLIIELVVHVAVDPHVEPSRTGSARPSRGQRPLPLLQEENLLDALMCVRGDS